MSVAERRYIIKWAKTPDGVHTDVTSQQFRQYKKIFFPNIDLEYARKHLATALRRLRQEGILYTQYCSVRDDEGKFKRKKYIHFYNQKHDQTNNNS